jgi:hypothetical protein
MSQNNQLVLVGFYQCIKSKVLNMSSVFHTKNLQDTGIDNVLFLEKSCRKKMYTILLIEARAACALWIRPLFPTLFSVAGG